MNKSRLIDKIIVGELIIFASSVLFSFLMPSISSSLILSGSTFGVTIVTYCVKVLSENKNDKKTIKNKKNMPRKKLNNEQVLPRKLSNKDKIVILENYKEKLKNNNNNRNNISNNYTYRKKYPSLKK